MKKVWIILLSLIAMMFSVANAETEIETPLVVWLEGEEYEMPCKLSELLDDGWVLRELTVLGAGNEVDAKHHMFKVGERGEYALTRNRKLVEIELKNEYPMPVEPEGCMVVGLNVQGAINPADISYEGLRIGRTKKTNLPQWAKNLADAIGIYISDVGIEENYKYKVSAVWGNKEKIYQISISAEHPQYTQAVWDELEAYTVYRPDSFDSYIEPDKLDKDWSTGMILLDGKLYQLPTPIEQFIQNGWVVEEQWVLPGKKVEGKMVKGEKTVQIYAHNIMGDSMEKVGQPAKLSNCEADGISSQDGVYMRSGRFEIGMSEFEMKLIGNIGAQEKLERVGEWEIKQYGDREQKNVTVKQYELVTDKKPEGLLKKPEGHNHMHYRMNLFVKDGVVTGIEVSY